jgi:hypothetical protein
MPMLSCSRFPAYTNLPSSEVRISEQKLLPAYPGGRLERVLRWVSVPASLFQSNRAMVEPSSWIEYSHLPFGWKWKCRGPSPGGSETESGVLGVSLPVAASNFQT